MHPHKASRLDGTHAFFFQKFRYLIGGDMFLLTLKVLNKGLDISAINVAHTTLIPEITNPFSMTHFQPISLGNVL